MAASLEIPSVLCSPTCARTQMVHRSEYKRHHCPSQGGGGGSSAPRSELHTAASQAILGHCGLFLSPYEHQHGSVLHLGHHDGAVEEQAGDLHAGMPVQSQCQPAPLRFSSSPFQLGWARTLRSTPVKPCTTVNVSLSLTPSSAARCTDSL